MPHRLCQRSLQSGRPFRRLASRVLGAFLVLRSHARIVTLVPLVVYWAMQFFNGFLALTAARGTQEVAGVAWWAHVGGFLFGAVVAGVMRVRWRNTSS